MDKQKIDKEITIGFTKMFFWMATIPLTVWCWDYVIKLEIYNFTLVSLLFLVAIFFEVVFMSDQSIKLIEKAEDA